MVWSRNDLSSAQNKHQEAITYILKAIEFDNNNLDYWINLGYVNEDAGLIEEALKCYAYVTRTDATDLDGWIALTGLLMKEGDFEQALNFLREAFVSSSWPRQQLKLRWQFAT